MGLCDALRYEVRPTNAAQRVFQRGASTKAGAWLFSKTAHHLDRLLLRRTHGRTAVATLLAGLPIITVTTTGAKSGLPRTLPLLGIPIDGELALIGTNFGQSNTPGWVHNLEADPSARVAYGDRSVEATARRANPDEADTALVAAARVYPGYDKYRERITGREVKVFVLRPSRLSAGDGGNPGRAPGPMK